MVRIGEHDSVFGKVPTVANDQIFDYICRRAGIDADATGRHAASFLRVVLVELEHVAVLENQSQINDARAVGQICMLLAGGDSRRGSG